MIDRTEVIHSLSQKFDPRNTSWEFRAILDVLQEEEPLTVKELEIAIVERYECALFTYKQLYDLIQGMIKRDIIRNNQITKQYTINPEYQTKTIQYLPISTYSVVLLLLSVGYLLTNIYLKRDLILAIVVVVTGALYLLAQYLGAEFNMYNGWKQFFPKPFNSEKKNHAPTDTDSEIRNSE